MGQTLRHEQRLSMSQAVRLAISQGLRIELIRALRGEHYEPKAQCESCGYTLKPEDILRGFNDNPTDYTTQCPKCNHRFEARLVYFFRGNSLDRIELPLYCPSQTTAQLTDEFLDLTPETFEQQQPALYRSALLHFGSLKNAFRQVYLDYPHVEVRDWRDKVKAFLGQMSDSLIAECVGVPSSEVTAMRRSARIPSYRTRRQGKSN
jgi:hypothetical protein